MSAGSGSDYLWSIEYDESDPGELWVYKLDHEPIADGGWHRLNQKSDAYYRMKNGRFQLVCPDDRTPAEDLQKCLDVFAETGSLDAGAVEVWIYRLAGGYRMWSYWLSGVEGPRFEELTPVALRDAYEQLLVLEEQADEE